MIWAQYIAGHGIPCAGFQILLQKYILGCMTDASKTLIARIRRAGYSDSEIAAWQELLELLPDQLINDMLIFIDESKDGLDVLHQSFMKKRAALEDEDGDALIKIMEEEKNIKIEERK